MNSSITFSDEFISDLRARWDQRKEYAANRKQYYEIPAEPIYDEVYENALDLMDQDECGPILFTGSYYLAGPDSIMLE